MQIRDLAEDFTDWLEGMQPSLNGFVESGLPTAMKKEFSRSALAEFERYLLDTWADRAAFQSADVDFVDGAVRYVGEALLRAFGGGWHFTDEQDAMFTGVPFVLLDVGSTVPISPLQLLNAALSRRTGQVLVKVWDGQTANLLEEQQRRGPGWRPVRLTVPGVTMDLEDDGLSSSVRVWTSQVGRRIESLRSRVDADSRRKLDLSRASLPVMAAIALSSFASSLELQASQNGEFRAEWVTYVGETLLGAGGGSWVLRAPRPGSDNPYFGQPFILRSEGDREWDVIAAVVLSRLLRERDAGLLDAVYGLYVP